jgi:hypothetical protein
VQMAWTSPPTPPLMARPMIRYEVGPRGNGIKVPKWMFVATT